MLVSVPDNKLARLRLEVTLDLAITVIRLMLLLLNGSIFGYMARRFERRAARALLMPEEDFSRIVLGDRARMADFQSRVQSYVERNFVVVAQFRCVA
jgi:hypothetical protein